jgi:hypothetical protein
MGRLFLPITKGVIIMETKPNLEQAESYLKAFDFFNVNLFDNTLPRPMLLLSRNANIIGGYFSPNKWGNGEDSIHEIALNANMVSERDIVFVMAVLVHEMIHLEQHIKGDEGRRGYHNQKFADRCKEIGLEPKDLKTGKEVGQSLTTTLIPGSRLEDCIADLPDDAIFPWECLDAINMEGGDKEEGEQKEEEKKKNGSNRAKYTCAQCGLNAWAKPGAKLVCGECDRELIEQIA